MKLYPVNSTNTAIKVGIEINKVAVGLKDNISSCIIRLGLRPNINQFYTDSVIL